MEAIAQFIIVHTAVVIVVTFIKAYRAEREQPVHTEGEAVTTDAPIPNGVGA